MILRSNDFYYWSFLCLKSNLFSFFSSCFKVKSNSLLFPFLTIRMSCNGGQSRTYDLSLTKLDASELTETPPSITNLNFNPIWKDNCTREWKKKEFLFDSKGPSGKTTQKSFPHSHTNTQSVSLTLSHTHTRH